MSRIFEALKRVQGNGTDAALSALLDAPAAADVPESREEPIREVTAPPVAVPRLVAVNGNAHDVPATAAGESLLSEVRTMPLRIPASVPALPFDGDQWQANEQYRIIRTRLIHHGKRPRMLVVSSAGAGDGKTITAVNLAGVLSLKSESKVLLIDADFRRSAVYQLLGLPHGPGLADVLRGACALEEALIHTEQLPNLYVLTAGQATGNPAELLDSAPWPSLCTQLRQVFRYVVLDSPPIAAVADYDLIQAVCDGVLLVLRPDHTNRTQFKAALQSIPREKLIGTVLNCVPDWFLGRYHSPYYYGDYGRYGRTR